MFGQNFQRETFVGESDCWMQRIRLMKKTKAKQKFSSSSANQFLATRVHSTIGVTKLVCIKQTRIWPKILTPNNLLTGESNSLENGFKRLELWPYSKNNGQCSPWSRCSPCLSPYTQGGLLNGPKCSTAQFASTMWSPEMHLQRESER